MPAIAEFVLHLLVGWGVLTVVIMAIIMVIRPVARRRDDLAEIDTTPEQFEQYMAESEPVVLTAAPGNVFHENYFIPGRPMP